MDVIIAGKRHRLSMEGDARLVQVSTRDVPYGHMHGPYVSASLKGEDYSAELQITFGELSKLVWALGKGAHSELHMCRDFLEQQDLWQDFKKFKEQKDKAEARSAATVS